MGSALRERAPAVERYELAKRDLISAVLGASRPRSTGHLPPETDLPAVEDIDFFQEGQPFKRLNGSQKGKKREGCKELLGGCDSFL
jgi:hypothetical protein